MRGRSSSRRGFTLIELVVAFAVGSMIFLAAGSAISTLMSNKRGSYKRGLERADLAIQQARVMEYLLRDIRSSVGVPDRDGEIIRLSRYVRQPDGTLSLAEVTWEAKNPALLVRTENGVETRFRFQGLVEGAEDVFYLKVESIEDDILFDAGDAS